MTDAMLPLPTLSPFSRKTVVAKFDGCGSFRQVPKADHARDRRHLRCGFMVASSCGHSMPPARPSRNHLRSWKTHLTKCGA